MRRCLLVAACLAMVLSAGCSDSDDPQASPPPSYPPIGEVGSYAALGDSYVSGPEIDDHVEASGYCLRSTRNYPSLLAIDLGAAQLADVSCGGATTEGIMGPSTVGGLPVAAQIDAVTPGADLVTIGIGGNDDGLIANLVVSCLIPASRNSQMCQDLAPSDDEPLYPTIEDKLVETLDAVQAKAPGARVLLVGYLRVVDGSSACEALQLDRDQTAHAADIMDALENTQLSAARQAGVEFVSLHDVSSGHDSCSDDPWVNGLAGTPGDGAFFHPDAAGMKAAADTVMATLREVP